MNDDWFAPKAAGYGTGVPIAWQGWALLGGYLLALFGLTGVIRDRHPVVFVVLVAAVTLAFAGTAARHTRGGWRWRWVEDDD